MDRNRYENPLSSRYASREMNAVWSPQKKFSTWRRLWVALATAERELGLTLSEAALDKLGEAGFDLQWKRAKALPTTQRDHRAQPASRRAAPCGTRRTR